MRKLSERGLTQVELQWGCLPNISKVKWAKTLPKGSKRKLIMGLSVK